MMEGETLAAERGVRGERRVQARASLCLYSSSSVDLVAVVGATFTSHVPLCHGSLLDTPPVASVVRRRGRAQSAVVRAEGEATPAAPAFDPKSVAYLKPVKDVNEIMKILPHRYPFLLVDRVLDFEARVRAHWGGGHGNTHPLGTLAGSGYGSCALVLFIGCPRTPRCTQFQKHCVAIKLVTVNDNFFPGHFPQRPIMPGVLQIEALAQAG